MIDSMPSDEGANESPYLQYEILTVVSWEERIALMRTMDEAVANGEMSYEQMDATSPAVAHYRHLVTDDLSSILEASPEQKDMLSTVMNEVLINAALTHGNEQSDTETVDIKWGRAGSLVLGYVGDKGTGFNLYEVPDPSRLENLDKANGRGLMMMDRIYLPQIEASALYLPNAEESLVSREFVIKWPAQT